MSRKQYDLSLLFTGHMVDLPGRPQPRFPPAMEKSAQKAIADAVERARQRVRGSAVGIASGARGGDTLFHEHCNLHGIETRMVLPFPAEEFVKTSVAGIPGSAWEQRFWTNWNHLPPAHKEVLLSGVEDRGYGLCNDRMLELALSLSDAIQIVALWDGGGGDGPGGTADFVSKVRARGGTVEIIDTRRLPLGGG